MGHVLFLILDCQRENPLFRSRLSENAQNVLDLGTGQGDWAIAVADKFPNREFATAETITRLSLNSVLQLPSMESTFTRLLTNGCRPTVSWS